MNIDKLVEIKPQIINNLLVINVTCNPIEFTDLRLLNLLSELEKLASDLNNERIKKFCFVFNVSEIKIPTNFNLIKDFADFFQRHENLIMTKLDCSVIESTSNIFTMFFSLFKKYYKPLKPLFLVKTRDEVMDCLFNDENRKKYSNICNLIN